MIISIVSTPAFPAPAVKLSVTNGNVILATDVVPTAGAAFTWTLLDANNNVVAGPCISSLTDEQYQSWGADDTVVAHAVAANIGVTPN